MSNRTKKLLVLLSPRIDPALFDARFFNTKVVSKSDFLPDFFITNIRTAFVVVQQNEIQKHRIQSTNSKFERTVILAINSTPLLQRWIDVLEKVPTLFVLPSIDYVSTLLLSILPLIESLKTDFIVDRTREYAEAVCTSTFAQAKSLESLSSSITLSTGVDEKILLNALLQLGSLQRLGQTTREALRETYKMTRDDAQSIASFFSNEEIEAPAYMTS
jgi:hypothetical protein